MAKSVYCCCNDATSAKKLYLFGETAEGKYGKNIGGTTTGTQVSSTSSSRVRVVAVPAVSGVYCKQWKSTSSGATATNYGLLTFTGTSSYSYQNKADYGSGSGTTVTITNAHGTHYGTPAGTNSIKASQVIGVFYKETTDSSYTFAGWKVTFSRSTATTYPQFLSTFASGEATTSGSDTTITAAYAKSYAIVIQLGSSTSRSVTIEALYESSTTTHTLTYAPNGGSSTPTGGSYATGSVVTLAAAITRTNYTFNGWLLTGESTARAAKSTFTMPAYDVTATAQWTSSVITYTLYYQSNGGSPTYSNQTCTTGNSFTLQGNPTKSSYDFAGWQITIGGTVVASGLYKGDTYSPTGTTKAIYATAQWTEKVAHTLKYETGYSGGTAPSSQTGLYSGDTVTLASALSRTGYTFGGWYLSHSQTVVAAGKTFTMPATDVTATGQWTAATVVLTYYHGYDSGTYGTQSGKTGTTITLKAAQTRSGYTFLGWLIQDTTGDDQSTRTYKAGASYTLRSTATATALWSQLTTYTIQYNKNGTDVTGDDIPNVYVTQGNQTVIRTPSLWSREGYAFVIWNTNSSGTGTDYKPESWITPTGSMTLYAIWETKDSIGSRMSNVKQYSGTSTGIQQYTDTTSGYQFYFSSSVSTSSISMSYQIADGRVGNYVVSGNYYREKYTNYNRVWDSSTGSYKLVDPTGPYYQDTTESDSTPYSGTLPIQADVPTNDLPSTTLLDIPTNDYSITSVRVNGGGTTATVYEDNSSVKLSSGSKYFTAPDVANYTFKGWYGLGHYRSTSETSTVRKRDFTTCLSTDKAIILTKLLNANCVCTQYTTHTGQYDSDIHTYFTSIRLVYEGKLVAVLFDAGDGTVDPFFSEVRYGETYGYIPTPTAPSGYSFSGWYTASSGGTKIESTSTVTTPNDHTLYARYTSSGSVTVTVTFDGMGATPSTTSKSYTVGSTYSPLPTITDSGKTLTGWYDAPFGGNQVTTTSPTVPGYDHTLYARWTTKTYTITLNPNSGTVSPTSFSVPVESNYGMLPTPKRDGYTFNGWYTASSGGYKVSASDVPTGNTTIYAQWGSGSKYTVTFNPNGGTVQESSRLVAPGGTIGSLPGDIYATLFDYNKWKTTSSKGLQAGNETAAGFAIDDTDGSIYFKASVAHTYTKYGASSAYYNIKSYPSKTYRVTYDFIGDATSYELYYVCLDSSYAIIYNGSNPYTGCGTGVKDKTFTTLANTAYLQLFFDIHTLNQSGKFLNVTLIDSAFYPGPKMIEGWYTAASGGTKITGSQTVSSNVTYYAHWADA